MRVRQPISFNSFSSFLLHILLLFILLFVASYLNRSQLTAKHHNTMKRHHKQEKHGKWSSILPISNQPGPEVDVWSNFGR